ncbi:glycosyltransferase family 2 protein [Candidatus Roizmanbacteria bacterium]|nr:glycosyltransferase family 2 protein [Candidatus Roizmanbacteria bacterium]
MKTNTLTAVILTKNEENNIVRAVQSVQFCNKIIVLDDNSTDKTVELAKREGAQIVTHSLDNNFAQQRNYALRLVETDWVLFIDADEEVSEELRDELQTSKLEEYSSYSIPRRDFFWHTELRHGETAKARNRGIVRLVKKDTGSWDGTVHEVFISDERHGRLTGYINHYSHAGIAEFLQDINAYSTLRATELFARNVQTSVISIIAYPVAKFFLTYVVYRGFLDGPAGFTYSFMMSFHSFLVRAKLYQYIRFGKLSV